MYCSNCDKEFEKGQEYCSLCGRKLVNTSSFWYKISKCFKSKKIMLVILSLIILSAISAVTIQVLASLNYDETENLYGVKNGDKYVYINEQGKEIFSLPYSSDIHYGFYNEGLVVVALTENIESKMPPGMNEDTAWVGKIKIYDNRGKEIPHELEDYVTSTCEGVRESCVTIYNNGVLNLSLNKYSNIDQYGNVELMEVFLDRKGKLIPKPENYTYIVYPAFPISSRKTFQDIKIFNPNGDLSLLGYVDKDGKVIIPPKYIDATHQDFDMTIDPNFYNGIAKVCRDYDCSEFYYMDINQKKITKEKFVIGYPFYRNLAYVETDDYAGYINTDGQWIYKVKK